MSALKSLPFIFRYSEVTSFSGYGEHNFKKLLLESFKMVENFCFVFYIYLKAKVIVRVGETERERLGFYLLIHPPDYHSSQGWAKRKPGASSRSPRAASTPACAHMAFTHHWQWLFLPCHNARLLEVLKYANNTSVLTYDL